MTPLSWSAALTVKFWFSLQTLELHVFYEIERTLAFYDKMMLPQIFVNTNLYFAKDKNAIVVTCKKLCSITPDNGYMLYFNVT